MNRILILILVTVTLFALDVSGDIDVWDEKIQKNCIDPLSVGEWTPCHTFVNTLKQNATSAREWAALGTSYAWMKDYAPDEATRIQYHTEALAVFQKAVKIDDQLSLAWLGLATQSESEQQKLLFLRKAISVDESNLFLVTTLARSLKRSGVGKNIQEAIDVLTKAYKNTSGYDKWRIASLTYMDLREHKGEYAAESFRQKVIDDLKAIETLRLSPIPAQELPDLLEEFCTVPLFEMRLFDPCSFLLDWLLENNEALNLVAKPGILAIGRVLVAKDSLVSESPEIVLRMRDILEQIARNGYSSVELYLQLGLVTTGEWRLTNYEKAHRLDKTGEGKAALWLGIELAEQGKFERAEQFLRKAVQGGAEWRELAEFQLNTVLPKEKKRR